MNERPSQFHWKKTRFGFCLGTLSQPFKSYDLFVQHDDPILIIDGLGYWLFWAIDGINLDALLGGRYDKFRVKINHPLIIIETEATLPPPSPLLLLRAALVSTTTTTTIIFITNTFIQLTGSFKQVLAGSDAISLVANLKLPVSRHSMAVIFTVMKPTMSLFWLYRHFMCRTTAGLGGFMTLYACVCVCASVRVCECVRERERERDVRCRQTIQVCLSACEHAAHRWIQSASRNNKTYLYLLYFQSKVWFSIIYQVTMSLSCSLIWKKNAVSVVGGSMCHIRSRRQTEATDESFLYPYLIVKG